MKRPPKQRYYERPCGHYAPCGCEIGAECCLECKLPVCTHDMIEEQFLMVAHLQHLVNNMLRRPAAGLRAEKRSAAAKAMAARLLESLRASRDGFGPVRANEDDDDGEAWELDESVNKPCAETVCPRCGTCLRRDYDDLVCLPCGYRTPAMGRVFTEYAVSVDAVVEAAGRPVPARIVRRLGLGEARVPEEVLT